MEEPSDLEKEAKEMKRKKYTVILGSTVLFAYINLAFGPYVGIPITIGSIILVKKLI